MPRRKAKSPTPADLPDRVADKIAVADDGCWLWTAATASGGYGHIRWGGRLVCAHRLVYHLLVDEGLLLLPGQGGTQLDHLCRIKSCVNPGHLEIVTNRENVLRGCNGVLGVHASRFVGVVRCPSGLWKATMRAGGPKLHLGYFADEVAAARAYDDAAEAHHGERTNERLGLLDPPGQSGQLRLFEVE